MKAKIQRHMIDNETVRLHEAVSDSVYVRGVKAATREVGSIGKGDIPAGKLTEVIDSITTARRLSLLHLSDNHGSLIGLRKIVELLENKEACIGIDTGDLTSYSNISNYAPVIKVMTDWNAQCDGHPLLVLKGNHDAWDISTFRMQEKLCTATLLKPVNDGFVKWGDPHADNGAWSDDIVGGYFYKDVVKEVHE